LELSPIIGFPKEAADQVYDMKKIAETEAEKVRQNKNLTEEGRQDLLAAIKAETRKEAAAALGEQGLKSYMHHGGVWIYNLSPPRPKKKSP
ncbi:MAG: hypothetical protein ACR2H1_10595, partial [Limisphaerales bacterium]